MLHLVGTFSAELWGLDRSGGEEAGAVCWRHNSWNSVMIILLLLTLPCSKGSSWQSTVGNKTKLYTLSKPQDHRFQHI